MLASPCELWGLTNDLFIEIFNIIFLWSSNERKGQASSLMLGSTYVFRLPAPEPARDTPSSCRVE